MWRIMQYTKYFKFWCISSWILFSKWQINPTARQAKIIYGNTREHTYRELQYRRYIPSDGDVAASTVSGSGGTSSSLASKFNYTKKQQKTISFTSQTCSFNLVQSLEVARCLTAILLTYNYINTSYPEERHIDCKYFVQFEIPALAAVTWTIPISGNIQ